MTSEILDPAFKVSLRQWLTSRRWFAGKARAIVRIDPADNLPLPLPGAGLMLIRVEYTFGPAELYQLMYVWRRGEAADRLAAEHPEAVVHRGDQGPGEPTSLLAEALADRDFSTGILELMSGNRKSTGPAELPPVFRGFGRPAGMIAAASVAELGEVMKAGTAKLAPRPLSADQSNSCVVFGRQLFLKLFRKLVPGVNPELEIGRFLAASGVFSHTPALCGSLEYKSTQAESEPLTLGLLQRFTPGKSAWQTTLDQLAVYFGRVAQLLPEDRPICERRIRAGAGEGRGA